MGGGGQPSGGVIQVYEWRKMPTPNRPGLPNAQHDFIRHGQLHTRRWTDSQGRPIRDNHYTNHGNTGTHPNVPHGHHWVDGRLGPEVASF